MGLTCQESSLLGAAIYVTSVDAKVYLLVKTILYKQCAGSGLLSSGHCLLVARARFSIDSKGNICTVNANGNQKDDVPVLWNSPSCVTNRRFIMQVLRRPYPVAFRNHHVGRVVTRPFP
ncbi:hypothetical protein BDV28DRAFT_135870 [Aspergillus coremiiformis]|uniref:Uncharacterized protein n=1 Tax=Aspergillus coremiiformis TaxID=138285 RepID=A0A5N6Z2W6_9EURO|nr:hypothetical protein BDV28DRAFT_135870 [Aspergillus coremiiformis]